MKKSKLTTALPVLVFLIGLSLLLYPTVSDYVNSLHRSKAVVQYSQTVATLDTEVYESLLQRAKDYNQRLAQKKNPYIMSKRDLEEYNSLLNLSGDGIMGYVEIPSIDVKLPVYHGTEESVLQTAVGHVEWTGLPVGGIGTHSVISGHRGLPSAKLFTNLDRVSVGDTFVLRILEEVLTYEVDQILIVLPEDVEALDIDPEKDYCTLVTCTPYGVNSHRMLVRGHRIETEKTTTIRVTADAVQIEPIVMAPFVAAPMLLLLLLWLVIPTKKKY